MTDRNRDTSKTASSQKTGAGAEAAEGIHATQQSNREPSDQSSLEGRTSASDPTPRSTTGGDGDRKGSEPLTGRTEEHVGSYGGKGGAPRTSSDTREG